ASTPSTLAAYFTATAQRYQHNTALCAGTTSLTYTELDRRSNQLARGGGSLVGGAPAALFRCEVRRPALARRLSRIYADADTNAEPAAHQGYSSSGCPRRVTVAPRIRRCCVAIIGAHRRAPS
ncbi:hypothetical protein, partial [Nocardia abscessus]|uniref:hypothetical protein n=1 Tax=Nocardia abscessus TaxID=120957 RepID=UPI0024573A34